MAELKGEKQEPQQVNAISLDVVIASMLQAVIEAQALADKTAQQPEVSLLPQFERRAFISDVEMQLAFAVAGTKRLSNRATLLIMEEKLREIVREAAVSAAKQLAVSIVKFASSRHVKDTTIADKTISCLKEVAGNLTGEPFVQWASEQVYVSLRQNVERFVNDKGMVKTKAAQAIMKDALRKAFTEHPDIANLVHLVGPELLSAAGLNLVFHLDHIPERLQEAFAMPKAPEERIVLEAIIQKDELAKLPPASIQSIKLKFHLNSLTGDKTHAIAED